MSTLNFKINTGPLTLVITSDEDVIIPQTSKIAICSSPLVLKLKLKLDRDYLSSTLLFQSPFFLTIVKSLETRMKELKLGEVISTSISDDEVHINLNPTLTSTSLLLPSEISSPPGPLKIESLNILFAFTIPSTSSSQSSQSITSSSLQELKSQILSSPLHPSLSSLIEQSIILLFKELSKRFPLGFDLSRMERIEKDKEWWEMIGSCIENILNNSDNEEIKKGFEMSSEKMENFLHPLYSIISKEMESSPSISTEENIVSMLLLSTRHSLALSQPSYKKNSKISGTSQNSTELDIEEEEEENKEEDKEAKEGEESEEEFEDLNSEE